MSIKEHFLEWIIRPEHYYIQKYLRYLRKEEYYSLVQPCRLFAFYYKAKKNRLGSRLGFIISAGCFDEGLKLEHYGSVIVNPKAKIGKNCIIHGNCCIGSNGGYPDDSPTIGDNVDIGQNAQILGGIRIADGIKIGAGAIVVKDFLTPGITIAGVPAKEIIK